ncbi:PEP-CTERM sorting domain-containing protein [Chamaesiphon sp. VAR_48_metabat_135_sub]|uniref:PEP-CTERM sorting domain-containing protein n=1 Tax=Chamaesiphon sp. VAR_48_metabat_135_sub TaxID=2964699 RepID=UPI00286A4B73|nr:PEP-CTERM sorting domain-containing protein [Chamaesiphon sp. VAR_48_metabat_135_sub]
MNYQRLALAFLSIGTVSAWMGTAQAATITHAYNLNNTLADSYGGPSLVTNGGTLAANGYSFAANQGLNLTGAISQHKYSILVDYKLSNTVGYNKVIDFKNFLSDAGIFHQDGNLTPYPVVGNNSVTVGNNETVRLVLTRNGLTGAFSGYFNGMQQFSFDDTATGYGSFTQGIIQFFQDDNFFGGLEASAGMVGKIVIFDDELSSLEVATLGNVNTIVPGAEVPEPFTIVGTLVGGTAALRMRKKLKATDKV